MALTGLAIAAALALAKDQFIDQPAAKRKRKLAAETERNSPWTGLHAGQVDDPNTIGTMMQFGATGAQMGAGIKQSNADANLRNSMAENMGKTGEGGAGALGGGGMSDALGAQSDAFSKSQQGSSWFYGNSPRPSAQPFNTTIAQDASNPYASLYAANINPDAPSYFSAPPNFFKSNKYSY